MTWFRKVEEEAPGMDGGGYLETRGLEEDAFSYWEARQAEHAAFRSLGDTTLRPWPLPFPGRAWLDLSRFSDGLPLELWHVDELTGAASPVARGQVVLDSGHGLAVGDEPVTRAKTWREVQAEASDPAAWQRLDTEQERNNWLGPELVLRWGRVWPGRLRLVVPDNDLVTPFDLTRPDLYGLSLEDGTPANAEALNVPRGTELVVYLKPRRWRYLAKTIAHYIFVSPFETVPNDEVWIRAWHDRPPFYPLRTQVLKTKTEATVPWYDGTLLSYDPAIAEDFRTSRARADMCREMVAQQFFTLCLSYIFLGAEDCMLTIWRERVQAGEPVAVLERRGVDGGVSRVYVTAKQDLDEAYPRTLIGLFYGPFWCGG